MQSKPVARPGSRGQPGAIVRSARGGNSSSLQNISSDRVESQPDSASQLPALAANGSQLVNVFQEVQHLGGSHVQSARTADALANVSPKELEEIRQMRKPAPVVQRTIEVVCLILDAHKHPAPSAPPEWSKVQRTLEQDFINRMLTFDLEVLRAAPKLSRYLVMEYFGGCGTDDGGLKARAGVKHERLTYQRVMRASSAAASLFRWCCILLDLPEEEHAPTSTVGGMLGADADAPVLTSFSTCPAVYCVDQEVVDNYPVNEGGLVTDYSVSPLLPEGLLLDSTTGTISGMPTVAADGVFVITATGPGGVATFSLHITITSIAAPSLVSFSTCPAKYIVQEVINDNYPINEGGPVTNYSSSRPLPRGLVLDSRTGVISGSPEVVSDNIFSITATGPGGADTFSLRIAVGVDETVLDLFLTDAKYCRWDNMVKWLQSRPYFVNMRPEHRRFCAIHHAAYVGEVQAMRRIVYDYGGDPNVLTSDGKTAKQIAQEREHEEAVEFLTTLRK